MRNYGLFLFFLCVLTNAWCQELLQEPIEGLKENIHLHLNKTAFLNGERLWFKAYVFNQNKNSPAFETNTLHVGIYGDDGEEIKRKLFYVENGMAQGDFGVDSTFTATEYKVLAWTNYMRNFKELEPFQQRIKILKNGVDEVSREVRMKISIYPEGGELIAGVYNTMGILVDNGLGQGVMVDNLELVDEMGKTVHSNIKTNPLGMGKTGFFVAPQMTYYLQRKLPDGSLVRRKIPVAIQDQLGLNVDNSGQHKVLFTLLASRRMFFEKDGDAYTMALYRDNFVRFDEIVVNADEPVLSVDRKELPFGVLTAVLFNSELRPISHRMFFNYKKDHDALQKLEIDYCPTAFGDSIQIDLALPKDEAENMSVSLSALPASSFVYRPSNSIASSFLLRPYVKTHYQGGYFFENLDRRKRYELDNRLLIEGWGKYHWDSRKQEEVELAFEMETGIQFQGKIMDANLNEENQVSLIAELSGSMGFEVLDKDKSFMGNMQLFEGDSLGISAISKKGKLRKPKAELQFQTALGKALPKDWLNREILKRQWPTEIGDQEDRFVGIGEGIIALEEVTVVDVAKRENKFQISPLVQGRLMDDNERKKYTTVRNYIAKLGYLIRVDGFEVTATVNRYPYPVAPIIIDGMSANTGEVLNMPLSSVAFLTFNRSTFNPFISIALDKNYVTPSKRNKFLKFAIENGYAQTQDYFVPNYPDHNSPFFKRYGVLDWKANIMVGPELPTSLRIPRNAQEEIVLYLEGMTPNGKLVVMSKTLSAMASKAQ